MRSPPAETALCLDDVGAIVLDVDGTLLDSTPPITDAINAVRARLGLSPRTAAAVARTIGGGLTGMLEANLPVAHHPDIARVRSIFHTVYSARMTTTRPLPGAEALVIHLKGRATGLVTNKPRRYLDPILDHLGWSFPMTVAGDDGFGRKPDPGPLAAMAERLGVPIERILFVGDTEIDRQTAANAGARFVGVPGWTGHGPALDALEDLCRWR